MIRCEKVDLSTITLKSDITGNVVTFDESMAVELACFLAHMMRVQLRRMGISPAGTPQ
jgi:hypothetical protein